MGSPLVDHHQARLHGRQDVLTFILIVLGAHLENPFPTSLKGEENRTLPLWGELVGGLLVEFLPLTGWLAFLAVATEGIVAGIELNSRHFDIRKPSRIVGRYLGTSLHIEVDGWHCVELAQGIAHSSHDNAPNLLFILELNLRLGGMDVNIDVGRIDLEEDEVRHLVALRNEMGEGLHHSIVEARVTHEASVDEEELRGVLLAGSLGLTHETANLHQRRLNLYRQQLLAKFLTKDADDALQGTSGRQMHQPVAVA